MRTLLFLSTLLISSNILTMDLNSSSSALTLNGSQSTIDAVYSNNYARVYKALKQDREALEASYMKSIAPEQEQHRAIVAEILNEKERNVFKLNTADRAFHAKELEIRSHYLAHLRMYLMHTLPLYSAYAARAHMQEQSVCKKMVSGALCLANTLLGACIAMNTDDESIDSAWVKENKRIVALLDEFSQEYEREIFRVGKPRVIPEDTDTLKE